MPKTVRKMSFTNREGVLPCQSHAFTNTRVNRVAHFERINPTPPPSARSLAGDDTEPRLNSASSSARRTPRVAWAQTNSNTFRQKILDFGAQAAICKQAVAAVAEEKHRNSRQLFWTYGANQPDTEKPHGMWRHGIPGYQGFSPEFCETKRFYVQKQVGKPHPPYMPPTEAGDKKGEAKRARAGAAAHDLMHATTPAHWTAQFTVPRDVATVGVSMRERKTDFEYKY
eukprot:gnl/MRDRNA2_/MRDRNA2_92708_c0_seq1.p1 gnl/MRDRNA2_/MRDRNA2_92708_c0~~gnl/MRDRNA2_/MRDRNA2_92708_c0_seq1.p1  ORF type:complete len:227 (+),score=24.97 gnl/MRDRNA2_/MRDRNA2_92708_c0_seq1:73-753(+)